LNRLDGRPLYFSFAPQFKALPSNMGIPALILRTCCRLSYRRWNINLTLPQRKPITVVVRNGARLTSTERVSVPWVAQDKAAQAAIPLAFTIIGYEYVPPALRVKTMGRSSPGAFTPLLARVIEARAKL